MQAIRPLRPASAHMWACVGLLLAAGSAQAQNRPIPGRGPTPPNPTQTPIPGVQQQGNFPGQYYPGGPFPPQGGQTSIRVLPPEPLLPNSLGLLERDFQYMRSTAPRPNEFLYGRWNPRYEVTTTVPRVQFYPGYGYGQGYGYGYGQGYYGYAGFSPYGFTGGVGFGNPNVIQREVVIVREGASGQPGQPAPQDETAQDPNSLRRNAPPRREPTRENEFYLGRSGSETLPVALDDIRKAWLNGDYARLAARFKTDGQVRVFPRGQFKYAIETREFTAMLKDAMTRIDTTAFALEGPRMRSATRAFVGGRHTFLDAEKMKQETFISYLLERSEGRWYITEAGSSSTPIGGHTE